jgi:hypothetical protein
MSFTLFTNTRSVADPATAPVCATIRTACAFAMLTTGVFVSCVTPALKYRNSG